MTAAADEDDWIYADAPTEPTTLPLQPSRINASLESKQFNSIASTSTATTAGHEGDGSGGEELLKQQNMILVRNMARLFLTAKRELTEKNTEIRRLQLLLEQHNIPFEQRRPSNGENSGTSALNSKLAT